MEIFGNLINVFTVTFDEFMAEFIMHPYWIILKKSYCSNKSKSKGIIIHNKWSQCKNSFIYLSYKSCKQNT